VSNSQYSPDGILVIDKPAGMTSHDVVARVRRHLGTRRVGHAGTLDPMATGLLVLGIGRATRLLTYLVGADKEYLATIRLGASTTTDDAEGEVVARAEVGHLDAASIRAAMSDFTGSIMQVPSAVSAIKVQGKRAYARVRAGEAVELAARPVRVAEFTLLEIDEVDGMLDCQVRVACSSGTYIRALARDLGEALGCKGHVAALRRTRVGPFELTDAVPLDHVDEGRLSSLGSAARRFLPTRVADRAEAAQLVHGRSIPAEVSEAMDETVAVLDHSDQLVAITRQSAGVLQPVAVFSDPSTA
jgi:tRNA pseudouridine55 synthase